MSTLWLRKPPWHVCVCVCEVGMLLDVIAAPPNTAGPKQRDSQHSSVPPQPLPLDPAPDLVR